MLLICFVVSVWGAVLVPTSPGHTEEKDSNHVVESPSTPTLTFEHKSNEILKEKDLRYTVTTPTTLTLLGQKTTSVSSTKILKGKGSRYAVVTSIVPTLLGQKGFIKSTSKMLNGKVLAHSGEKSLEKGSNQVGSSPFREDIAVTPKLSLHKRIFQTINWFSKRVPYDKITPSSSGLYISVKTTSKYHSTRLPPIFLTWFQNVLPEQVCEYMRYYGGIMTIFYYNRYIW
jgi:hypothetical protein